MKNQERVIYKKNPLIQVIYQLRFPTILSINSKEPAEFQETIRNEFPIYNCSIERQQTIEVNKNNEFNMPIITNNTDNKNYSFTSTDGEWQINLTSSFISISTNKYTRWEELREKFNPIFRAFCEIYHPAFFNRIGLRYIDAFTRSELGLANKKWCELLEGYIIGYMSIQEEGRIKNYSTEIEYSLEHEDSFARINAGLGTINNKEELSFIIDGDYYKIGMIKQQDVDNITELLHERCSEFIRNAIKEELHYAMEPESIEV